MDSVVHFSHPLLLRQDVKQDGGDPLRDVERCNGRDGTLRWDLALRTRIGWIVEHICGAWRGSLLAHGLGSG